MNMWGGYIWGLSSKNIEFKSSNLLYKSNFYLLSEATVQCKLIDFRTISSIVLIPSTICESGLNCACSNLLEWPA